MKAPLAAILLLAAVAADAPTTPPTPPPAAPAGSPAAFPATPAARPDTGSYVGIVTAVAPPALRSQLGLPAGVGVVVESVEPDSPAARAGLAVYDVVTRLDDQWVINPPQFSVLVRMRRPGETVRLTLVRRGRPEQVPVRLGEKPLAVLDAPLPGRPAMRAVSSIVTQSDAAHQITLTTHGGDCRATVIDHGGATVYDGPLNTPQDRERLPPAVRGKVATLEKNWERYQQLRNGMTPGVTPPATAPTR